MSWPSWPAVVLAMPAVVLAEGRVVLVVGNSSGPCVHSRPGVA